MALNLIRNARAFFTTNLNSDKQVAASGFTTSNTFEIQVLDGLSFSQNTTVETVTLNEAGATPNRGQRGFNSALDPAEFTFSTYIRPKLSATNVICEEQHLWNALAGTGAIGNAGAAWTVGDPSVLSFANSNAHQMQSFGMIFVMDGGAFVVDNCALDQASIDFGLDAIATVAWTGRGTKIRQIQGATAGTGATVTFGGGLTGSADGKDTTAKYIANKLSTMTLTAGITGTGSAYNIPITGGNITIANNITYLTPANLGVVNEPITYFTGTRSITGNTTCYLRTGGTNDTGDLIDALVAVSTTDVSPAYEFDFAIGGAANATKVQILMPAAMLQLPTIATEQVVSTTINFTAMGSASTSYDLDAANEAEIKYYAGA